MNDQTNRNPGGKMHDEWFENVTWKHVLFYVVGVMILLGAIYFVWTHYDEGGRPKGAISEHGPAPTPAMKQP